MGCEVLYTARAPKPEAIGSFRPLDALLAEADVVSLHIPETPETRGLINAAAIARMKRGAVLVNTARGGLVDQAALMAALESGHLAAAGLDVFSAEPVNPTDPLLGLPNVVLAPHIAWQTTGTFARSFAIAAENCQRLQRGEPLLHRVA
jgi:phosphoglycerate dehydrogenase-like enzyme